MSEFDPKLVPCPFTTYFPTLHHFLLKYNKTLVLCPLSPISLLSLVLGQIPTSVLGQIPTSVLGQIPTSVLGQIPTSVLGHFPRPLVEIQLLNQIFLTIIFIIKNGRKKRFDF